MMKFFTLLLLPALLFFSLNASSQATAVDFVQDECGGNNHHLFSELEAGNVVILDFVMLNCAPCILGTTALQNIVAPYEASQPGRVHIYSFGFLNSYTCEQILAWKADNNFTHPVFNNGEDQVNYYGGMGMPTIVVTGTNEHKVFFKSIGYTSAIDGKIIEAIDSALLYNPTGVGETESFSGFRIYPTIASDFIRVETGNPGQGAEFLLFDTFGRQVLAFPMDNESIQTIQVSGLAKGIYIARLKDQKSLSEGIKLIIR
jgi:hypothetical protein